MENDTLPAEKNVERVKGVCKSFDTKKGYGFIICPNTSSDVFVHNKSIHARGFRSLREGEDVEFDLVYSEDGRPTASHVTGPGGKYVQGERITGHCKSFDPKKGYGFIICPDSPIDVFVHNKNILAKGFRCLQVAEEVEFDIVIAEDGKPTAVNVTGPNGAHVIGRRNPANPARVRRGPKPQRPTQPVSRPASSNRGLLPKRDYHQNDVYHLPSSVGMEYLPEYGSSMGYVGDYPVTGDYHNGMEMFHPPPAAGMQSGGIAAIQSGMRMVTLGGYPPHLMHMRPLVAQDSEKESGGSARNGDQPSSSFIRA